MILLWKTLDKKYKHFFVIIVFLLFISSLLEMIGLSFIVPIVLGAIDQNLIENLKFASVFKSFFYGFDSK